MQHRFRPIRASLLAALVALAGCGEPDGPIEGDPDAFVSEAIADVPFEPRAEDYTPDEVGALVSHNTLMLAFTLETHVGDANAVLGSVGAEIVGAIGGHRDVRAVLTVRVPTSSHAEVRPVVASLRADPRVAYVVQDSVAQPTVVPRRSTLPAGCTWDYSTSGGGNWGIEQIRMPQAWNLNEHIRESGFQTIVRVLDVGFGPHPDVQGTIEGAYQHTHGIHVAGTIGARFNDASDATGVDGVNPFSRLSMHTNDDPDTTTWAWVNERIARIGTVPVVNISMGYNHYKHCRGWAEDERCGGDDPADDPTSGTSERDQTARDDTEAAGEAFADVVRNVAQDGPLPVIVTAAGNDNSTSGGLTGQVAEWGSPMNYAALRLGIENLIVVEATDSADARTDFSCRYGHVSAPGRRIFSGVLTSETGTCAPGYGTSSGTSMAAPHVAGLVSFLFAFDPDLERPTLDANPVRDLLRDTGVGAAGAANRIDAYAAVVTAYPDRVWPILLDIDDGTFDGNDRTSSEDVHDGDIDMGDFRRFRDHWIQIFRDGANDLDEPMSPKRDPNGNGVPESAVNEGFFPRADFNGDRSLDETQAAVVPGLGNVTDLEILQRFFEDPDVDAAALPGLLESGDVFVDATACRMRPDLIELRSFIVGDEGTVRMHTFDETRTIWTLPRSASPYRVVFEATGLSGEVAVRQEQEVTVGLGSDETWEPRCGFAITSVTPDRGAPGNPVQIEGQSLGSDVLALSVFFEDPGDGSPRIESPIDSAEADATGEITTLHVTVPAGVDAQAVWLVVVEKSSEPSNPLVFRYEAGGCIVALEDLTGASGGNGTAVNWRGNALWNDTAGAHVSFDELVWDIPCDMTPIDINGDGRVVGDRRVMVMTSSIWRAFVWDRTPDPASPGACVELPMPATARVTHYSRVAAVNESGDIAGRIEVGVGTRSRVASWIALAEPTFDQPPGAGGGSSYAVGIDSSGVLLAYAEGGGISDFFWDPVGMSFDTLDHPDLTVSRFNDTGQRAGTYRRSMETVGAIWDAAESPTEIGVLEIDPMNDNERLFIRGFNDLGQASGLAQAPSIGANRAFLYLPVGAFGVGPGLYDLNDFLSTDDADVWTLFDAVDLNEDGVLVGRGRRMGRGTDSAFRMELGRCVPASTPLPHTTP